MGRSNFKKSSLEEIQDGTAIVSGPENVANALNHHFVNAPVHIANSLNRPQNLDFHIFLRGYYSNSFFSKLYQLRQFCKNSSGI